MDVFGLFAHPYVGDYHSLAEQLAPNLFRSFCTRAIKEQPGGSDPLLESFIQDLDQRPATAAYWTPEQANIVLHLQQSTQMRKDPVWLRTQIAVAAHLCGLSDSIHLSATLNNEPLLVRGDALSAAAIRIEGDREHLRFTDENDVLIAAYQVVHHHGDRPIWQRTDRPTPFITVDGKPVIPLVGTDWHHHFTEQGHADTPKPSEGVAAIQAAFDLLQQKIPEYHAWILCFLREITCIPRPDADSIASNSSGVRWGGIDIAAPASVTEIVEMLVHECSHQYFHCLYWLGPLATPEAGLVFSPLKNQKRPFDRILLGYHAFGNALLVFDRLKALGYGPSMVDRVETVNHYMAALAPPLVHTEKLTDLGRAFYEPLRDRLFDQLGFGPGSLEPTLSAHGAPS
ncbi:aKG-HExxH-type peptide beta-hydroxylase [Acanthopleuribacter pedis]|uniref:HEXXH motif domain-containing protein n=1 Tax=Acanthopleuribacter pedis TaxID=442870 RepID=A0A8J7QK81_9BACT|nr:HEXXH motif-containing putative peptide modification protein [Acanthopleuribacter pedis]MBO1319718.1 hypothetical protein [Acanthopleuribacter pedis]